MGLHAGGRRLAWASLAVLAALAAAAIALVAPAGSDAAGALVGLSGFAEVAPVPGLPVAARTQRRERKPSRKGLSLTPSATEAYWACPEGACEAIVDPTPQLVKVNGKSRYALPDGGALLEGSGELGGYDPQDLQSAYKIPIAGGETQTIALVDAYGYPTAEEDLAKYRERYGLPPCTKANGCFRKINQKGEEGNYPAPSPPGEDWATESALDMDMASAACPHCRIMLAEANNSGGANLPETANMAARLGATEISNSYSSPEQSCGPGDVECEQEALDYYHPGVLVTAAGGDNGYDNHLKRDSSPNWPAVLPFVVAVGGTALHRVANARGWSEQAWPEGGSGCSLAQPKPVWQTDTGCATRMTNDVSSVAACETPVSTYSKGRKEGWANVCGTSASSPLVAGIEAHASEYARSLPGADAFYQDPEAFFDVTAGSNGTCTPPESHAYFCQAQVGYDGPTGVGTPDGAIELSSAPAPTVHTTPASSVAGGEGTLNGEVDPQGAQASYHFEYGTTTAYGTTVPLPDAEVGAGRTAVQVSQTVAGLKPDTVYHYRLVASNANGTAYGSDSAFSTAPPTVTAVSPAGGPTDGGSTVTISGTNLQSAVAVNFGARPAQTYTVTSESSITAVSPQGAGAAGVTVTTPAGTSEASADDRFTYNTLGPVLAWGNNEGRLGDGSGIPSDVAVEVSELPEAVSLAAGYDPSAAVLADGTVMAWGRDHLGDGQLSGGSEVPVHVCAVGTSGPCPEGPYLEEATAVAAGNLHTLALLDDGTVVAWGNNEWGQLGSDSEVSASAPHYVCTKAEEPCKPENRLKEVVAIAAGELFSLALLRNGTVVSWGANEAGQLGIGKAHSPQTCRPEEVKVPCSQVPVAVRGLDEVSAISAGGSHSLALLKNGTVVGWGEGLYGQLGDGTSDTSDAPAAVCAAGEVAPCKHQLGEVTAVSAGYVTSLALLRNGTVEDWGSNYHGLLGHGSFAGPETCGSEGEACSRSPVAVSGLREASAIAAGNYDTSSLAVAGGQLMTWGGNKLGQLGNGALSASDVPVHVCQAFALEPCPNGPYLGGEVTALAVGGQHDLVSIRSSAADITGVSPGGGPGRGGTAVTITGSHLAGTTAVRFGNTPASEFEVLSASEIRATAPPGRGVVDVTATTPEGITHPSVADRFSYEASTVTGVSPGAAPGSGGTQVTITGTKFTGASAVDFGGAPAGEYEVRSDSEILAVSPPGGGVVDVTVTTPEGTSPASPADRFTYQAPPAVSTGEASAVHIGSAVLNASVDPEGVQVSDCHFEYGISASYGASVPCQSAPGSGSGAVPVAAAARGLGGGVTYHFRIVAANSLGTSYGADRTFTPPSSELPELGRCVKLARHTPGKYENSSCTTAAAAGGGSYEWEPGPGAKPRFSSSGGAVTIDYLDFPSVLACSSSTLSGEYTGPQSATVSLVLDGCASPLFNAQCSGEGATEGQVTATLQAQLGIISQAKKPSLGWELQPAGGAGLASFSCNRALSLTGAVIGPVTSLDKMAASFALALAGNDGRQVPENLLGSPDEIPLLGVFGNEAEPVVITMSAALTGEEPLELKAIS